MSADDAGEARTTEGPGDGVAVLVGGLAARAVADSNLAMHRRTVVQSLTTRMARVAEDLRATDSPLGQVGHQLGQWLVAARLTGPALLSTLVAELQNGLLPAAGLCADRGNQARLAVLCGQIIEGYLGALREQLLGEQESLIAAALAAQHSADAARRRSEARLAAVFTGSGIGIGIGRADSSLVDANPALCRIVGREAADLCDRQLRDLVHPADRERLVEDFMRLVLNEIPSFSGEFQMLRADGEVVWTYVTVSLLAGTVPSQVIATVEDVSGLQLLRGEFIRQNSRDWLTGLSNQTRLRRRIEELTDLAAADEKLALCYFDIDGFKVVNDGLGREIGDVLLRNMGTVLRSVFDGRTDLVARVGGDAFAALVAAPESTAEVVAKVTRVQQVLGEPIYIHKKHGVAVSVSVGIVVYRAADIGPDELIRAAEITLHRAKAAGKAQWMVFESELDRLDRRRYQLGAVMPGAVEVGEFEPLFSPVRLLADGTLTGYHAGLRWRHAEYGLLSEGEFGALADQVGLGLPLGTWLIRRLCAQLGTWRAHLGDPPALAFSLTPRAARDRDLVDVLRRALDEHGVPAELLFPCFPASVLTDPHGQAARSVDALAELGLRVAVDGFGDGANLLRLRHVRAVVARLTPAATRWCANPDNAPGLAAFTRLAHRLGMVTTATDADTEAEVAGLRAAGVDATCGEAMGPPLTARELTAGLLGGPG